MVIVGYGTCYGLCRDFKSDSLSGLTQLFETHRLYYP